MVTRREPKGTQRRIFGENIHRARIPHLRTGVNYEAGEFEMLFSFRTPGCKDAAKQHSDSYLPSRAIARNFPGASPA